MSVTTDTELLLNRRDPLIRSVVERGVPAGGTAETIAITAPYTGETIAETASWTAADVHSAAAVAREAQPAWAARPVEERAKIVGRLQDLALARQDEVLDLIQLDTGKARAHAFEEVLDLSICSRYYANTAKAALARKRHRGAIPLMTTTWEYHQPLGVIAEMGPWNYPLVLPFTDAIPALIAGNAVLLKPDHRTPLPCLWAASLLDEIGVPPEIAPLICGDGAVLGTPIIDESDFVMYTGSTDVGRIVARQAAERLIESSMELGGKNAMIVMDDPPARTIESGMRAMFSNAGQLCISMERLFVHESIFDKFTRELAERISTLRLGTGVTTQADVGSLTFDTQLARVQEHVQDAVDKGATVLAGGKPRPDIGPYFYEPTLLADVTPDMTLCENETFGPVVSAYPFSTADEAIELANASDYGLNFSVWTKDTRAGLKMAERLEAGTININEGYAAVWGSYEAPMGGFKASGIGRRHGEHGITKYTDQQAISIQHLAPLTQPSDVSQNTYQQLMTTATRLMAKIPGIR